MEMAMETMLVISWVFFVCIGYIYGLERGTHKGYEKWFREQDFRKQNCEQSNQSAEEGNKEVR